MLKPVDYLLFRLSYSHQFVSNYLRSQGEPRNLGDLVNINNSYSIFESSSGKGMVKIEDEVVILDVTHETETCFAG